MKDITNAINKYLIEKTDSSANTKKSVKNIMLLNMDL